MNTVENLARPLPPGYAETKKHLREGTVLTKSQLIAAVARQTGVPAAQVTQVLDALCATVADRLSAGEKVTVAGFGRFEMRSRQAKAYTNPKTKQSVRLEPSTIPGFKASGLLKQRLAGK